MAVAEAAAAVEIAAHKRHFERSSVYLIINTALSGGLGTLFWLLAARIYPEEQVGPAVAAASLLLALAFAAQLNLPTALSRFLPSAGDAKRSMVWFCYRISFGGGVLCGVVLIAATYLLGGQLFAGGRMPLILVLAISVPVWTIFAMQDSVMIAARSSGIVPIENAVSTIAKFAVLPIGIVLGLGDGSGILLAWTVPTLIAIPAVNYIIFTRILKRPKVPARMASHRKFVGYALRDFPGAILYLFSLRLIPLIIVSGGNRLDGAYIGLPWTILTVAALALPTLSRSLLAELSHEDSDTQSLLRRANRLVLRLVLPAAVAAALLAHPVMRVAGGHYASRGAPVLAWGILGLVPAALVESQLATLRFQGAVTTCSFIQAARAIGLVGGVVVLLQVDNASGIGIVLLVVNAVAAVVGWLTTRHRT
jgi:O-antigen/teichoic acid export membrane protein